MSLFNTYCLTCFSLVLAFTLCRGVYNRYFHSLARFPGPFWASITEWHLVFTIVSVPTNGLKLHERYGQCVISRVTTYL